MSEVAIAHPLLDEEKSQNEPEPLEIRDFFTADNTLMKMIRVQQEIDQVEDLYQQELEQLKSWKKDRLSSLEDKYGFYKSSLEAWLSNQNKKKADLPHGRVYFRKQRHKVKILDEDKVIESGKFVRVKKKPDKRAMMQTFKQHGLIPEGTDIFRPESKFYVKLKNQEGGED